MPFFPHLCSERITDRPRWLTSLYRNDYRMSFPLEDDDHDEIHCEHIGSGKWLANITPRRRKTLPEQNMPFNQK